VNILIVRLRLIGDVVFTTPLLRALRRLQPGARLTYLVEPLAAPVVQNNPHLDAVRARAVGEGAEVVPVSAAIEEELSQLDDEDRDTFLHDMGLEEPGLNRVIRAAYKLLGLQTYFTAGVKEVRAWTVKGGSTAPQAAAVIHTDFEKGFIRAETIGYDDFIRYRGESGARDAGRLRLEGKEYRVQEGDVLHFRFNV